MKIYEGEIPFTHARTKKQLDYATKTKSSYLGNDIFWHDNIMFYARLKFVTFERGRSSATFLGVLSEVSCQDITMQTLLEGCEVSIFMVDMLHIVKNIPIINGTTSSGLWAFCKRGSSYGIKLYDD